MRTVTKSFAVPAALLALTFAGGFGLNPAAAQDNMSNDQTSNRRILTPRDMIDPLPFSYPWAAPASLHQYHWIDYTQTRWEPGSVSDVRFEQRRQMMENQKSLGMTITEDTNMLDPLPFSYPWAAPASIHQYHWIDYTQTRWEPGSVADVRFEQRRQMQEKMRQQGMTVAENPEMMDPLPFSYPWAAPASLHQYHWTDYTMTRWEPGSVSDVRFEQMRKQQQEAKENMQGGTSSGPTPSSGTK